MNGTCERRFIVFFIFSQNTVVFSTAREDKPEKLGKFIDGYLLTNASTTATNSLRYDYILI